MHPVRLLPLLLTLFLPLLSAAQGSASSSADRDWQQIRDLMNSGPGDTKGRSRQEIMQWFEDREEKLRTSNLAFFENHPHDMRRWEAVLTLMQRSPRFITGWEGDVEQRGYAAAKIDRAAAERWKARRAELEQEMARALPTLTRELQQRFEARPLFGEIGGLFEKLENKEPVDWPALRQRLDRHLDKYADQPGIAGLVSRYMGMFERDHTAEETVAEWRALTTNPLVRQSEMVAKRLEVIERETGKPMELKFTAADGREVDLEKLRGKVVLIDFWATWCGPCIAELPNVKKVYADYRDQGFEVIGISLENANLKPTDTPEQTAAKHAAARKKLLDFCAANDLPWPQHYDGQYWNNEISRGRFNINAVPATFLLDRNGVVAVVNVRGPQLETEVRRLLKQ